jgi:uncharacterized PurR-regulated membrane protein YhhQ (DUF165 family)
VFQFERAAAVYVSVGEGLRIALSSGLEPARQEGRTVRERPGVIDRRTPNNFNDPERDRRLRAVRRLAASVALPVIGLLALLALSYLYRAEPVPYVERVFAGARSWLSLGSLGIPLTFFAIHLASRRYGAAIAGAQVAIAWIIIAVAALIWGVAPALELGGTNLRIAMALCVSLLFAHFVAVVAFDATRSRRWWAGPLHGFFWACLLFAVTFFPAAYLGTAAPWFSHMTQYFIVSLGVSAVALVAYWIARPLVPPLHGLAGY